MTLRKTLLVMAAIVAMTLPLHASDTLRISLDDAIIRARARSVDAAVALNQLRTAYWEYRTYRADLLPEVNFNATLPSYYKAYTSYMDAEGNYSFVPNNYLQLKGELSVVQKIWFTGGELSLNTSLDFMRQLSGTPYSRYMTIPVALTLNQPIFGVNDIRWSRRIEPVRYAEAKARFLSDTETVAMNAIDCFFGLLMARENLDIARQNLDNATKLYEVAREKRAMGQISQNDLLQMELNLLDARSDVTSGESDVKSNMFALRSFLDYGEDVVIVPMLPPAVPDIEVTYDDALSRARENNRFVKEIRRRQLEADYDVAKAKAQLRQINLFAQVGYNGTDHMLGNAYRDLRDNQIVELGFSIPLIDWGKRRGKVKVARSNREVVMSRIRQETQNFNQDIFILVERFCNQQSQLRLAKQASEIASQRYQTNVATFLIGRISTLDLNDSQLKNDQSRQNYINELYRYWHYYYQLRSVTLWDYAAGCGIDADIDQIVRN